MTSSQVAINKYTYHTIRDGNMKLHEIREDVELEIEPENGDTESEKDESNTYNQVFNAVANHFDIDGEEIDELDDETKKEFFNMIDQCWDEEEDKVPDGCPIDIDLDDEESDNGDEDDESSDEDREITF